MPDSLEQYSRAAVAARLKEARSAKFASAAELARELGMKEVTVRAHENGQNGLSTGNAKKYAKVLGVTPEWLLYGADDGRSTVLERIYRENVELAVGSLHYRVPIWQEAKADAFQRLPPRDKSYARGFLSLLVTGYESLAADAFEIADEHAASVYAPGTFVITGPPSRLDLRNGDHVVVARTLPSSNLTETTVRGVEVREGRIILTSLGGGGEAGPVGVVTGPPLEGTAPLKGSTGYYVGVFMQFGRDILEAMLKPDAAVARLEEENSWLDRQLAELRIKHNEQGRRLSKLLSSSDFVREETRFLNGTSSEVNEVIGIILASYSPRTREGHTLAQWDRSSASLKPV